MAHISNDRSSFSRLSPSLVNSSLDDSQKAFCSEPSLSTRLLAPAGSGKTLLASIFLQELMLKYALPGRFIDLSRQFFQRLKRSYDNSDELYGTSGQILDELVNVPFLVIDDFGVQRNTEWESEMLYTLIDSRYAEERVTILTSNADIKDYKKVAMGRVHSRILEMCKIVHVDLPDYRESLSQHIN